MTRTMTRTLAVTTVALAMLFVGCDKKEEAAAKGAPSPEAVEAAQPKTVDTPAEKPAELSAAPKKAEAKKVEAKIEDPQGEDHGEEDCAAAAGATKPQVTGYRASKGEKGETIIGAGAPLTNAAKVTVAALLEKPGDYVGKTVTLEGDVSAMCHHKRGWFALAASDKSGKQVRVLTMPAFKVPPKSIGRTVVVEGVVEQIEVSARMARHLAKGHQVGAAETGDSPVKRIILRAKGGSFADMAAK